MRLTKLLTGKSSSWIITWSCSTDPSPRDLVAEFWPNAGTPGSNIKNMYDRIANSVSAAAPLAQQEPPVKVEPPQTNGQVNGVGVKQEQRG